MSSINTSICPSVVLQWEDKASKVASITGVPTALILAFIDQESGGNSKAKRFEPNYMKKYCEPVGSRGDLISKKTGIAIKDIACSYGLMQPMFMLAYGYGAKTIEDLYVPEKNLTYCAAHIANLLRKEGWTKGQDILPYITKVAGKYNGAGASSKYACDVKALYLKYNKHLRKA